MDLEEDINSLRNKLFIIDSKKFILFDYMFNMNMKDRYEYLDKSIKMDNLKLFKYLVGEVTESEYFFLHYSMSNGSVRIVKYIMEKYEINRDELNNYLMACLESLNYELVEYFINKVELKKEELNVNSLKKYIIDEIEYLDRIYILKFLDRFEIDL